MLFGLASRVVVVLLGLIACRHDATPIGVRTMDAATSGGRFAAPGRVVESWYRFDAIWYVEVANLGYSYREDAQSSAAFLPLLPWCMRAGSAVGLPPYWIGLIVPNLAFAVGLAAFGRLAGGSRVPPGRRGRPAPCWSLIPGRCSSRPRIRNRSRSR